MESPAPPWGFWGIGAGREGYVYSHSPLNNSTCKESFRCLAAKRFRRRFTFAPSLQRIEEGFAWIKMQAGRAKTRLRGMTKVDGAFVLTLAAYNLIRLPQAAGSTVVTSLAAFCRS